MNGALQRVGARILADGHILLEAYPGLAKTVIARSFAQSMICRDWNPGVDGSIPPLRTAVLTPATGVLYQRAPKLPHRGP